MCVYCMKYSSKAPSLVCVPVRTKCWFVLCGCVCVYGHGCLSFSCAFMHYVCVCACDRARTQSFAGHLLYNNWTLKWGWVNFNRVLRGIPLPLVPQLRDQREFSSMVSLSLSHSLLLIFAPFLPFSSSSLPILHSPSFLILNSLFQSVPSSWAFVFLLIPLCVSHFLLFFFPHSVSLWNLY